MVDSAPLRSTKTTLPSLHVSDSATVDRDIYFSGSISMVAGTGIAFDGRTISNTNANGTVAGVIEINNETGSIILTTGSGLLLTHSGGTINFQNIGTLVPGSNVVIQSGTVAVPLYGGPGISYSSGTITNSGTLAPGANIDVLNGTVGLKGTVTTTGWIWQQGRNRAYYQNLDYATTTSSTPVDIGSVVIITKFSGHVVIDNAMRTNNELDKAGLNTWLYVNSSTLIQETYYTDKASALNETALPFHYELIGEPIGSTLIIGLKHATAGIGGTVISRMIGLTAEEI